MIMENMHLANKIDVGLCQHADVLIARIQELEAGK